MNRLTESLRIARADSVEAVRAFNADLRSLRAMNLIDSEGWERERVWLESRIPRWWQRSDFLVPTAVVLTVWLMLRLIDSR